MWDRRPGVFYMKLAPATLASPNAISPIVIRQ